jgi:hypothetical protein
MSPISIPLHARSRLNRGYAASLRHAAGVIAAAPSSLAPDQVDFTPVLSEAGTDAPTGHVILTWLSSGRALRLEFDADGLVDYWCDPDVGPLPVAVDGDLYQVLFTWLAGEAS